MKNKLIKLITITIAILSLAGFTIIPAYAEEGCNNICCSDASDEIKAASGCKNGTIKTIDESVLAIINGVLGLLAVVAITVIVYAGIQFMTSTGDSNKVKKAKDTILYACIGLIIVALAAVIVNFVIDVIPK